jgi:hypothetical protein
MLLYVKKCEFCIDCKGVSDPQNRFEVGLIGKLMVEFSIGCVRIFLIAGPV